MNKEDAIKHYTENYVIPYFIQSICELQHYVFTNKASIRKELVKAFKKLCQKTYELQNKGEKEKIKYINISTLRTAIITRTPQFIIEAYNNEWYFDSTECTEKYEAGWLLDQVYQFLSNIAKEKGKYIDVIKEQDVHRIILDYSKSYFWYATQMARYSIEQLINSQEFLSLEKEEEYYILSGEYKDYSQIIYCNQNSEKDSKAVKDSFESQENKKFSNRFYRNLDLTKGNYNLFDFSNTSFEQSDLSSSQIMGSILSGINLKNSSLKGCKMSASIIHDANFESAELDSVQMEKVYADVRPALQFEIPTGCIGASLKNAKIYNTSLKESILYGAQFSNAKLIRVNFQDCDLQHCDFSGAVIKDTNFHRAKLNNSIFNKEHIKILKLNDEQMKSICIIE